MSAADTNLRLGFEAILRQLGTSPLRVVTQKPPPLVSSIPASAADLRHIIKALDSSLRVFARYDPILNPAQRRIQILVRATRRYAEEELNARMKPAEAPTLTAAG